MTATKTKRKGLFLALPILALLFLISTAMTSGTFAKYASTVSGQDTALIAKWKITSNNLNESTSNDLHIFDHLFATHVLPKDINGDYIIAPGVSGDFTLNIKNESDVDAYLDFKFEEITSLMKANPALPIQFSASGVDSTYTSNLSQLNTDLKNYIINNSDASGEEYYGLVTAGGPLNSYPVLLMKKEINPKVYWRWTYEGTDRDGTDTQYGKNSAATTDRTKFTFKASITATQVAPIEGPAAKVNTVVLTGTTSSFADQDVKVELSNATTNISVGATVTDWFNNIPQGLKATVKSVDSQNKITITISKDSGAIGTSTAPINLTIPSSAIVNGTADIIVNYNNTARYDITNP